MYVNPNFKTKKAFKLAVKEDKDVTIFSPGLGVVPVNGIVGVEGPHHPQPHRWYASVTIKDGKVIKVK